MVDQLTVTSGQKAEGRQQKEESVGIIETSEDQDHPGQINTNTGQPHIHETTEKKAEESSRPAT